MNQKWVRPKIEAPIFWMIAEEQARSRSPASQAWVGSGFGIAKAVADIVPVM